MHTQIEKITLLFIATMLLIITACKGNNNDPTEQEPCPFCDTCLLITDINNCPKITEPTCIKFDDAITSIPEMLYYFNNSAEQGNITGICGENVDTIGNAAFHFNKISKLFLPNLKWIGCSAFFNNQLTKLDLPYVEYISPGAFSNNQLTKLVLENVKHIGSNAFALNPDLIEVHIYTNPDLLVLEVGIFNGNSNTITVYIKNGDWKEAMEEKLKKRNWNAIVKVL